MIQLALTCRNGTLINEESTFWLHTYDSCHVPIAVYFEFKHRDFNVGYRLAQDLQKQLQEAVNNGATLQHKFTSPDNMHF